MGQKIHPIGFRLAVNRNWTSRWFASPKDFPKMLQQDIEIRDYVRKNLGHASIGKITIERPSKNARITIFSSKPGVVIGKKGEGIEKLRQDMQKKLGVAVAVNIEELRKPELDAQIIGDGIAQQLEKRVMFRRAMKRSMQQAMRLGAQGIKIECSGRLNGIEIARSEWYREGRVPMHTLRSNIDYANCEAKTTYGIIGVKVWVYRGDSLVHEVVAEGKNTTHTEEVAKDVNVPRTIRLAKKKEDEVAVVETSTSTDKTHKKSKGVEKVSAIAEVVKAENKGEVKEGEKKKVVRAKKETVATDAPKKVTKDSVGKASKSDDTETKETKE